MSFLANLELNFAECVRDVGKVTLGVRQREGMDATHRMRQKDIILQAVCALLNSGGGLVRAEIENRDYDFETDGVGLDLPELFRNYLDMLHGKLFLMYVSSWDVAASHVRVATLCSNLYHRCGTSTEVMNSEEALTFLRRVQTLRNLGDPDSLNLQEAPVDDNQILASHLFNGQQLQYLEKLNFTESPHIEFQRFSTDLSQGIRERLPKSVSALANSKGGYVFFGVHDETCQVIGCEKERINCLNLRTTIDACIRKMPVYHFCAQNHKVQYALKFLEVYDKKVLYGYVCAIKVERFCCAAFAKAPDSWEMKDDNMKQLTAHDWASWMIETDPELPSFPQMIPRRSMLNTTPRSRTVFIHKYLKCVEELQKDYFPVLPNSITYTPKSVCKDLFSDYRGLRNWAVDLGLQRRQDVICDALLISPNNVPILYTICNKWDLENRLYSMRVAHTLKQRLVNMGGYTGRLGIIPLVLQLGSEQRVRDDLEGPVYPESYCFTTTQQVEALLQSLVVILFGFRPLFSEESEPESETVALLTDQQYELLSRNLSKHRSLFVHGSPGSGKTTLALKIMEKIRNVFNCQADDILYICENQSLKRFVRKNTFQAVTRKTFMKNTFDNVQHIIVDEAQNFRTEEGDWYAKAKAIVQRGRDGPGVLYIFLDYFQICHLCCIGLPELKHQRPILKLTSMLRSGDNITNYLQNIMHRIRENPPPNVPQEALTMAEDPVWGPDVTGSLEIIDDLNMEQMAVWVAEKCQDLWRSGFYPTDVAVLFSKARDVERCRERLLLAISKRTMSQLHEEPRLLVQFTEGEGLDSLGNQILLDSVHRFSGMERSIVFGIISERTERPIFNNVLLCLASRARAHLYIINAEL
ncbi:Schlafen family member 5 [Apodemus speciosus]|uniref:Schlafen family member 5 n=1 Tax=Apodemus speciosus TaxID=105296 RepID=A0ABQ0FBF7_APOSI